MKYNKIKDKIENFIKNIKKQQISFNTKIIIVVSILFLVVIIFNIVKPISKKDFINNLQNNLEKGKISWVERNIMVDGQKVSSHELKPVVDYYLDNTEDIDLLISNLKRDNVSGNFEIESKKSIFGEKYYLNAKSIEVIIEPSINEADIYINDEKVDKSKVVSLVPGAYEVKYKLKTDYGDLEKVKQIDIFNSGTINIKIDAEYITLYSNFEDAEVWINGNDTRKTVSEIKSYGPILTNRDTEIYIKRNFPWGTIQSEKVIFNDESIMKIDIDMANDTLLKTIEDTLNKFYISLFEALNKKDYSLIVNVDENVKEEIYNSIYEKTTFFSNNYTISDLQLRIENSEFKYIDNEYKANILVDLNYKIAKKILPFIKNDKDGEFLVSLIYKDGNWVVDNSQKIELDLNIE